MVCTWHDDIEAGRVPAGPGSTRRVPPGAGAALVSALRVTILRASRGVVAPAAPMTLCRARKRACAPGTLIFPAYINAGAPDPIDQILRPAPFGGRRLLPCCRIGCRQPPQAVGLWGGPRLIDRPDTDAPLCGAASLLVWVWTLAAGQGFMRGGVRLSGTNPNRQGKRP